MCVRVLTTLWCCSSQTTLCGGFQAIQESVDFIPELDELSAQVFDLTRLQRPWLTIHCRKIEDW